MLGRKRVRDEDEKGVEIADDDYENDDPEDGDNHHHHEHHDDDNEHSDAEEEDHLPRHLFQQLFTWQSQVQTVHNTPQSSNLEPTVPDFIFTFENCTLVENFHPFSAGQHVPLIQVNLWAGQITLAATGSEMYTYDLVMGAIPNEPLDTLGDQEENETEEAIEDDEEKEEST